ncbi:SLAP domain-containing protein [Clostridium sp.]|uniref:SLAP domain-containing protein n=1 Tax=Clostridium sp. TaxID=1506 RepID=UPI003464DBDD
MENIKFNINLLDKSNSKNSKLQGLIMKEEIRKLPPMEKGEIRIDTLYIYDIGEKLECKLVVRSAMNQKLNLKDIEFLMMDGEEEVGKCIANLDSLGELPIYSATPFSIIIGKESFNLEGREVKNCSLVFSSRLTSYESKKLTLGYVDEEIDVLTLRAIEREVESMPPMKLNTYEVIPHKVYNEEEDTISAVFLLANSLDKPLSLGGLSFRLINTLNMTLAEKTVESFDASVEEHTIGAFKVKFNREEINLYNLDELLTCRLVIGQ